MLRKTKDGNDVAFTFLKIVGVRKQEMGRQFHRQEVREIEITVTSSYFFGETMRLICHSISTLKYATELPWKRANNKKKTAMNIIIENTQRNHVVTVEKKS